MRKLVIALALTSVAFAGSTAYFAYQLSAERERNAALAPAPSPRITAAAPHAPVTAAPAETRGPAAPAGTGAVEVLALSESGDEVSGSDIKKMQMEYGKHFLAELTDPQRRQELIAERKLMIRNTYPRVDRVLGLTPDEYSRFTGQLAKQQLDMQEASARCMLNPDCEIDKFYEGRFSPDDTSREINEILGPARVQKFEQYKNTMGERESVSQLRNRLSDDQRLSEENAEGLIAALADERQSIYREASQGDSRVNGYGFGAGMVFTGAEDGDLEARYESAKQNSQRLRDRAAQFLNPEQMRAFNEIQDETLIGLRSVLRNKDILTNVTTGTSAAAGGSH